MDGCIYRNTHSNAVTKRGRFKEAFHHLQHRGALHHSSNTHCNNNAPMWPTHTQLERLHSRSHRSLQQSDLDNVKLNQNAKYLRQRSLSSNVIVRTHRHTHTHVRPNCSIRTTNVGVIIHLRYTVYSTLATLYISNVNIDSRSGLVYISHPNGT